MSSPRVAQSPLIEEDHIVSSTPKTLTLTLTVAAAVALLVATQASPALAQARLPQELDSDRDGSADNLETVLGSDPGSVDSTPESFALADDDGNGVADACEDARDNDGDGATDGDDDGCEEPLPGNSLTRGLDVFHSRARITGVPGAPPTGAEFSGPAVVRRGVPRNGVLPVEMAAFQLSSADGRVILVEDPNQRSGGEVREADDGGPWSGQFDIKSLVVAGGKVVDERIDRAENPGLTTLPPVEQDTPDEPLDCSGPGCYKIPNGCHCPRTPELRIPVYVYTAKFDCGQEPSTPPPHLGPVTPGLYATKIVVHNPGNKKVEARKKVSAGRRNPYVGDVTNLERFTLPDNATTEIDCPDIWRLLEKSPPKGEPAPFVNGVVEVVSQHPLDVIGNYTYEVPKEKIEFRVWPCCGSGGPLAKVEGRRLKSVTLVTEDVLIDEEREARRALHDAFPEAAEAVAKAHIEIVGDSLGVGAGFDVEPVQPRRCLLIGPSNRPKLDCTREK